MDALWLDVSSSRNAARCVKEPLLALLCSAPTPGEQPLGLQRSRRNIIASYTRLQPLGEPSTTSPPCLLRNYVV